MVPATQQGLDSIYELRNQREIPFCRGLAEPILLGGVPFKLAVMNVIFGATFGGILHSWIAIGLCVTFHCLFAYFGHKDPQFGRVFWRYKKYPDTFHV